MVQIASGTSVPVMHTIELLDWATGGPQPVSSGLGRLVRNDSLNARQTRLSATGGLHG
jgi:glycolate oxidase iron-sulfur subunit